MMHPAQSQLNKKINKPKQQQMSNLPRLESTESMVDISLLDMMDTDEFLSALRNKTENNWRELWKETAVMVNQLKAARELLSIGSHLIGNKTTRKILDRLLEVTYILLNAERVYILELDPIGKELIVTHARDEKCIGLRVSSTSGIEGDVLATRVCANVGDVNQDLRYLPSLDSKTGHKTRSIVCAPIFSDGGVLGVIQATNKAVAKGRSPRDLSNLPTFTHNEALLLGFIATNVGLALKQCSLSQNMSTASLHSALDNHRSADFLLGRRLLRLDNDKTLQSLIETAYSKLDAERVSIFTYSAASKSLVCTVSQDIKGMSIPHDKGFAGLSFTAMRVINVPDTNQDERHNKEVDKSVGFVTRNLLCAPIISQEGIAIGVIQAVNKKSGPNFTFGDEEHIGEVCRLMVSMLRDSTDPTDRKVAAAAPSADGAVVPQQSVTLARCIGSMVLSGSLSELVAETESAIKINTEFDFARVYIVDNDRIVRAPTIQTNSKTYELNKSADEADNGNLIEQWKLSDLHFHLKQALQFSATSEFKQNPEDTSPIIPGLKLQHGFVLPVAAKAYPFQPGTSFIIAGHTTGEVNVTESVRSVLDTIAEYYAYTVNVLSERCAYEENVKALKQQYNLLYHALGSVQDYVIILNEQGRFVGCNKRIEDLLGLQVLEGNMEASSAKSASDETPLKVLEGMHYTQWLSNGNSPELLRDIENALTNGESRGVDSSRFTSTIYPEGVSIDYYVTAVENPDVEKNPVSPTASDMKLVDPAAAELGKTLVVVAIHLNSRKIIGIEPAVVAATPQKMNVLDVVSASSGVDVANSILSAIQRNFVMDTELEETLKSIMDNLSHTSRRMSISNANYSQIHAAAQQASVMLVNPSVELPHDIFDWEFDVLNIKDSVLLCSIIGKFFDTLLNVEDLGVESSTLARYIAEVGRHYHDRPFHNLRHAACVTHFSFMLIRATNATDNLKQHFIFGILLSAVVHDVDHPGNTNLFEINSGSELAIRYNDQSVLENHHCSTAFRLMRKPNMQVLSKLPKNIAAEIRKTIISCVMATDMAVHFDLIEETKKRAIEGWKFEEQKDQALLGKILLHAADLSNPVRPFHMTRQWAEKISIEFNDQVAREQALGMPVLGFMMTPDEKAFCKNETGFASFVVAPMWRAIASLYPDLNFLVEQLDSNLVTWKSLLEKIQAEEAKDIKESD